MKYWTDPWNPIVGCAPISVGCDNCYAAACASQRKMKKYERVLLNSKWTGEVHLDRAALEAPLHARKPRVYFNSMCDPFHKLVPDEWLDEMFEIMRVSNQHTFVICTKRAQRMAEYVNGFAKWDKFQNLYLGVTAENQECADARLPHLANIAAAGWNTWISYEPALGPVDWVESDMWTYYDGPQSYVHGIIAGGESGPNARPAHPDWFRACRDACADAHINFAFKQWGKQAAGKTLDGVEHWNLPWENGK